MVRLSGMQRRTLNRCPPEIVSIIATFACTDGGYTGCSLSRVSRYIRNATQRVRYLSIALTSEKSLVSFAQLLDSSRGRHTIRHLFLSVKVPTTASDSQEDFTRERRTALLNGLETVLDYTATMLITLAIHKPANVCLVCTTRRSFPALQDLAIPEAIPTLPLSDPKENSPRFPSLRRLHITGCNQFTFHIPLWVSIAETAPLLTHLRVSSVRDDLQLPRFLRVLLKVPPPDRTPGQWAPPTRIDHWYKAGSEDVWQAEKVAARLPLLKDVYVHRRPMNDMSAERRFESVTYDCMSLGLTHIAESTAKGAGEGILHLVPVVRGYRYHEAKKHWLDMVAGRNGPWSTDPPDDIYEPPECKTEASCCIA